jgi:hypothetical protein
MAWEMYGGDEVWERHRHRYEVNPEYVPLFEEKGLVVSGKSPDRIFVEVIELPNHPWFLACQFHPEFKSRPYAPHPIFKSFVGAAVAYHQRRVLDEIEEVEVEEVAEGAAELEAAEGSDDVDAGAGETGKKTLEA